MKLIKEIQKSIIEGQEEISFTSFSSFHLIVVTARVKGEKQISQQSKDDEDLTVEIDGKSFPIDSPVAFSGGKQHNLSKTVYFLTYLSGRDHEIILKADQSQNTATNDTEIMLLARAVYGEVGGESREAKIAVAWAIRNRVEDSKQRWGATYHEVILAKYQYEPFNNPDSKSFKKITQPNLENILEKQSWQDSYKAAKSVFQSKENDLTKGANHFYVPSDQPKQDWVDEKKFTTQIGVTRFYKL